MGGPPDGQPSWAKDWPTFLANIKISLSLLIDN